MTPSPDSLALLLLCSQLGLEPDSAKARCPAGAMKLSIMPDGSAYPCYLLFGRPEFRLGNILTDGLNPLLENPILAFFRTFEGNKCLNSECGLHSSCRGGCPAVSLLVSGHIDTPDPRCRILA